MNSYTLVLMISAFLNSAPTSSPTLAHRFVSALRYFADDFDPRIMSVVQNCIVVAPPLGPVQEYVRNALVVEDPFRPEVNAAANVTRFDEIQDCFRGTYQRLMRMQAETGTGGFLRRCLEEV